jgi:predicted RNase H-like HicB family nuclease
MMGRAKGTGSPLEVLAMAEVMVAIRIEPLEEGGYLATSNELQGLVAQGRTLAETMEIAQDVARKLIESCLEHGDPLPPRLRAALRGRPRATSVKIPVGVEAEAPGK